jgi:hypothetical protein
MWSSRQGKQIQSNDAILRLHIKLSRVAKELKKWDKTRMQVQRLKCDVANEVIFQLDVAQESRSLSSEKKILGHF